MPTPEEEEVLAFLRSEQDSYFRGDFDAFADHWHHGPEVRRILSGHNIGTRVHMGWEELLPGFLEGFRQSPQNFNARELLRWDNVQVQLSNDMAWVSYDQTSMRPKSTMHAPPFSHEVKIVQRFDGAWKLICLVVVVPGIGREDTPRIELQADGEVVSINELARSRLPTYAGLVISGGRPRARNRAYALGLEQAIERSKTSFTTNLPHGVLQPSVSLVELGEDEAGQPIYFWVSTEQERILISFDDMHLLRKRLQGAATTYKLSAAQTKLAELLASGLDLATAAENLEVSVNTLRTQLRRMFEKTNTHSQAALVSRLLSAQAPD